MGQSCGGVWNNIVGQNKPHRYRESGSRKTCEPMIRVRWERFRRRGDAGKQATRYQISGMVRGFLCAGNWQKLWVARGSTRMGQPSPEEQGRGLKSSWRPAHELHFLLTTLFQNGRVPFSHMPRRRRRRGPASIARFLKLKTKTADRREWEEQNGSREGPRAQRAQAPLDFFSL